MSDKGFEKNVLIGATVIALVAAAALRVVFITCDPPHGLSASRAEYTDEGLKFYQARNRALFGQWRIETPWAMQGHLRSSPVPTVIAWGVFEAFGAGRVQARCISIVSGVLSCGLLILIGVRARMRDVGLLAGAFAAVNFITVSYDRLALYESLFVCELLCAALFFLDGGWRRWLLCPTFLAMAYFTRVSAVVVIAAFAAAWVYEVWPGTVSRGRTLVFAACAATAVSAVILAAVLLAPGGQIITQLRARFGTAYFRTFPLAPAAGDLFVRTFPDSYVAVSMPLLAVLALLRLSAGPRIERTESDACGRTPDAAACEIGRGTVPERASRPGALFAFWFAAVFLLVAFLEYRPTRYYVLLLPPIFWLAAEWIVGLARGGRACPESRQAVAGRTALRFLAGIAIAGIALRFAVAYRHEMPMFVDVDAAWREHVRDLVESNFIGTIGVAQPKDASEAAGLAAMMERHVSLMCLAGFAVLAASIAWAALRRKFLPDGPPQRVRGVAALVLAVVMLAAQAAQHVSTFDRRVRRYEVSRAERELRTIIGDNPRACVAGNWAPTLCMGTPYLTLPFARGNGNAWETFKRFPVTHLVIELGSPNEEGFLVRTYPLEYQRCRLLRIFQIDLHRIGLFEYSPPAGEPVPQWPFEKRRK